MADSELARLQRRYRELTDQICELGFIATGSVIERYTVCAYWATLILRMAATLVVRLVVV